MSEFLLHLPPIWNAIRKAQALGIDEEPICGACSGIPPCCIEFYRTDWKAIFPLLSRKELIRLHKRMGKRRYIPCPKCLENGTIAKIRKCEEVTCRLLPLIGQET